LQVVDRPELDDDLALAFAEAHRHPVSNAVDNRSARLQAGMWIGLRRGAAGVDVVFPVRQRHRLFRRTHRQTLGDDARGEFL